MKRSFALAPLLQSRLANHQAGNETHPDANLLVAFSDCNLSRRERGRMVAHLAGCPECREVLALISEQGSAETSPDTGKAPKTWWKWQLAAAAAVGCLALSVIWLGSGLKRPQEAMLKTAAPGVPAVTPLVQPQDISKNPRKTAPAKDSANSSPAWRSARRASAPARPPSAPVALSNPPLEAKQGAQAPAANPEAPKKLQIRQGQYWSMLPPSPLPEKQLARSTALSAESGAIGLTKPSPATPAAGNSMFALDRESLSLRDLQATERNTRRTMWSMEPPSIPGAVRRSEDGGKIWETVVVDNSTELYALSATGADIWAGGAGGKLFHSSDDGAHWSAVPVTDGETQPAGSIVTINAPVEWRITIKTTAGETWVSEDGGKHWEKSAP